MYSGEPSEGHAFYKLLFQDCGFCAEMGRVALASSQLEAELIRLLIAKRAQQKIGGKPLGTLIKIARTNVALDEAVLSALEDLCGQRNYLTHNIYGLFIGLRQR